LVAKRIEQYWGSQRRTPTELALALRIWLDRANAVHAGMDSKPGTPAAWASWFEQRRGAQLPGSGHLLFIAVEQFANRLRDDLQKI
jgi:hypothetical protein